MIKKILNAFNHKINKAVGDNNISNHEDAPLEQGGALHNLISLREYNDENELFYNDNSIGFMLEVAPLMGASEDTINQITGVLGSTIKDDIYIQFLHLSSPRVGDLLHTWANARTQNPNNQGTMYPKLAEDRLKFLKRGAWGSIYPGDQIHIRDFRCFVVVMQSSGRKSKVESELISYRTKISSLLRSINSDAENCNDEDMINLVEELIHPELNKTQRNNIKLNKKDFLNRNLAKPGQSLDVHKKFLRLDDEVDVITMNLYKYPEVWIQGYNKELLGAESSDFKRISYPMLQVFTMYTINHMKSNEKAMAKSVKLTRNAESGMAKFIPSAVEQASEWREVNGKLKDGERIIETSYTVVAYAPKGEADKAEQDITNIYKGKGWTLNRERYTHLTSFINALPFGPVQYFKDMKQLGRTKTLMSWSAANLAPLQGDFRGMNSPDGLLLLSRLGQPFMFDLFESPANYNATVIGTSGSGKSFFMQELVTCIAGSGGQIVIYDDGRSFENTCKLLDGQFVEFTTDFCLNPYDLLDEDLMNQADDPSYRQESLEMITNVVIQMAGSEDNQLFSAKINEIVGKIWNEKGIYGGLDDIYKEVEEIAKEDNDYKHLLQYLYIYSKHGEYGKYFNGKATININKKFCVFELNELQSMKKLQGLVMMLLMFMTNTVMYKGDRTIKKIVLMDEAWSLLANDSMTPFIEGMARRVRKYNGSLIIGTQSMDDFVGPSAKDSAKAAWNNSSWHIYLMQNPDTIDRMDQTDEIKTIMRTVKTVSRKYSEVLITPPDGGFYVGRFYADPTTVSLFSSKADDKAKLDHLVKNEGYLITEALEKMAEPIWNFLEIGDQAEKKLNENLIRATKDINLLYSQKFKDLKQYERELSNREAEIKRKENNHD